MTTPSIKTVLSPEKEYLNLRENQLLDAIEKDLIEFEAKFSKLTNIESQPSASNPERNHKKPQIFVNPPSSILELEEFRNEKAAFMAQFSKVFTNNKIVKELVGERGRLLSENLRLTNENLALKREVVKWKEDYSSLKGVLQPESSKSEKITHFEAMMLQFASQSFTNKQKDRLVDLDVKLAAKDEELEKIQQAHKVEREELLRQIEEIKKHITKLIEEKNPSKRVIKKINVELMKALSDKSNEQSPAQEKRKTRRSTRAKPMKRTAPEYDFIDTEEEIEAIDKEDEEEFEGGDENNEYDPDELEEEPIVRRSSKKSQVSNRSDKVTGKKKSKTANKKLTQASNASLNYFLS